MTYIYVWPTCFITGEVTAPTNHRERMLLCADALSGWGLCHVDTVPVNFGTAMQKIGTYLEICPLPENFLTYAKQFGDH